MTTHHARAVPLGGGTTRALNVTPAWAAHSPRPPGGRDNQSSLAMDLPPTPRDLSQ